MSKEERKRMDARIAEIWKDHDKGLCRADWKKVRQVDTDKAATLWWLGMYVYFGSRAWNPRPVIAAECNPADPNTHDNGPWYVEVDTDGDS